MNNRYYRLITLVFAVMLLCAACDDMLEAEKPIYELYHNKMSIVGDATSGGWELDQVTIMEHLGGKMYRWEGSLGTGELKFAWQKPDFLNGSWYMAATPALAVEKDVHYGLVYVGSGEAPNNFKITESGGYRITLDLFDNIVTFTEADMVFYAVYVIGGATPGGWELGNAAPMEKNDDNSWTWTGQLKAAGSDGLKFMCKFDDSDELEFDKSPEFYSKTPNTTLVAGDNELIFAPGGGGEANMNFAVTAGTYTLTLYPGQKPNPKVVVVKQ